MVASGLSNKDKKYWGTCFSISAFFIFIIGNSGLIVGLLVIVPFTVCIAVMLGPIIEALEDFLKWLNRD